MFVSPGLQNRRNSISQMKDGTPPNKGATDKQTPMKGADFGKAIGIDKPANIRDKIRKWQTDVDADDSGAENAVASGPDDVKPTPSPRPPSTPKAAPLRERSSSRPTHTPSKSIEELVERPKSAKKPVSNKLDADLHIATAPKKRVVSDSHWRNKTSPPKDATNRPSPKPLPTAWVRPAVKRTETNETKTSTPSRPEQKPIIIFTSKTTGQRTRNARQRRPSRPVSAGNDNRRGSSGSDSAKGVQAEDGAPPSPKSATSVEKAEVVRVRRRRRAATSPRASLSADDDASRRRSNRRSGMLSREDSADEVLDKKSPHPGPARDDDFGERRRRGHRTSGSPNSLDRDHAEPASTRRRRSRRKSHQRDVEDEIVARPPEPVVPETPPKTFGNRLEAWLQTTPDPFVDADSRPRPSSRESVSTLELPRRRGKSDVTESSATKDGTLDAAPDRKENSRRRRSRRSAGIKVDTQDLDSEPAPSASNDTHDEPDLANDASQNVDGISPSPTLKRRGARRAQQSPTKERAMSLPSIGPPPKDNDDVSSAPSSSVGPSPILDLAKISLRPKPDTMATRRLFPSTRKRLSTIASVDSFPTKMLAAPPSDALGSESMQESQAPQTETESAITVEEAPASESGDQFNSETLTTISRRSTRRSRLASHADLISVLSMPKAGTRSIMSARSIRTNRSRLATASIADVMDELASDEIKYMRELRTLVDGVIPVLLSCVLSKSDSAVAAGLFSRSLSKVDPTNVTKPIVDMGVALERLKTLHRRVPKDDPDSFLSWAHSAQRVYTDYIGAWRLGFQDVVVNLAPADEDPFTPAKIVNGPDDAAPWDEGLPRNAEGYVVNGEGERVDVAYMLKRPLVRLKYLAKSIRGINQTKPSEKAEKMATAFLDLVAAARKRSNEEHARLEDEAASSIDPTRARDPRSLAPLAGVRIDPNRCVRARDHFDLHLYHSSGQEVSCQVELLIRDNMPGTSGSGDVLICEVDRTGRWLLLPPIQTARISARNGDSKGEIIVMVRGYQTSGTEWQEVFSLTTEDEQAGFEWVQMLGLQPVPPQLSELKQVSSILKELPRPTSSHASSSLVSAATGSTLPLKSRTPSPHEIEIPIGEQATTVSKRWGYETPERPSKSTEVSPVTPPSSVGSRTHRRSASSPVSPPSPIGSRQADSVVNTTPRPVSRYGEESDHQQPRDLNEAMIMTGNDSPGTLKRTRAKRLSKNPPSSPTVSRPSRQIVLDDPEEEVRTSRRLSKRNRSDQPRPSTASSVSQSSKGFSVWMPTSEADLSDESDEETYPRESSGYKPIKRPDAHRRTSSVPSMDLPSIPRLRKSSQPSTPVKERSDLAEVVEPPASAPAKLQKKAPEPLVRSPRSEEQDDRPPPVPPHRSPSPASPSTLKASNTPVFKSSLPGYKNKRRSSSPLKHEYEPSTATESSDESEHLSAEEDEEFTSESSDDELEDDVPTPLMPIGQVKQFPKVSPPGSIYTLPNGTITPSQSASNTPYRAVPQDSSKATKSIATLFSWSDAGRWDILHPEECSIVITPGKVEVFEMTSVHSKPLMADGDEIFQPEARVPLVAYDLTPLVPLRKSTAIDITIRSPPNPESRIKSGNYIMLRSRHPNECAELYAMINHSRCNNPTYIALQNARGPYGQGPSWAEVMDRQNAARSNAGSSGGWFGGTLGRRSSYRKTSTRGASISAATESSVGTMNTALRSALGRFSFGKNGRFNIGGSTLGSRSMNSFDTGSSGSGAITPPNMESGRALGAPAGITNTKCRLYERDTLSSRWRDMGAARLTIMLPDPSTPQTPMRLGKGSPGMRDPMQEKRIIITGKKKDATLLDATLSESCFERIARSGIAVSVWEDIGPDGAGTVGAVGGVSGAKARVFMIQMKSERECAYSYSLLGKLRY
ncbi:hypothetical protein EJ04DRAFT_482141 [Polyplosphaeria fusca]|uniref:Uncharacterized protein n=1 Tax=Polyplosphaeria fusca TaxID=682080 RepID=A0A9P4RBA0_9PLEO|nr:hypothetical protein EJ04DRAFT_482141 [Polyplosphaeria fusca]